MFWHKYFLLPDAEDTAFIEQCLMNPALAGVCPLQIDP
jgi:hypothetical protein